MPFVTIDDLPEKVKKVLTPHAQEIFLAAFNDAYRRTSGDEGYSFMVAWSAVGRNYEQQSDGSIQAITEKRALYSKAEHVLNGKHAMILQTLDRKVGETYLRAEDFKPTLDSWAGVPLIYVPKGMGHPDLDAWDKDAAEALKAVKGRVLSGSVKDPTIAVAGHPRLIATGDIKDKEVEDLIKEGKISLSTAFRAIIKENSTAGPVEPHHILIFEEDDKNMPKDEGSGVLNKEETNVANEGKEKLKEGLTFLDKARALFSNAQVQDTQENNDMADKELEAKLVLVNKELEDAKTAISSKEARVKELEGAIESKTAELKKATEALAVFEQKKKDEDWEAIKNKLPKGFVHKDKEAETRKLYEENPRSLMEKALDFKMKAPTGAEGESDGGNQAPRRVGKWNAITQKWED